MSWEDFWGGGQLGSQMQGGPEMGWLEKLFLNPAPRDFMTRHMWNNDLTQELLVNGGPKHNDGRDYWKEMLEREMWRYINRQPTPQMGVRGHFPDYQNMNMRPSNPMGVLGPRS
jgi:hypothetical protein